MLQARAAPDSVVPHGSSRVSANTQWVPAAPASPANEDHWIETYAIIVWAIMERMEERRRRRDPEA